MSGKTTRITIDLAKVHYDRLSQLETQTGAASKAEVVRKALNLYAFMRLLHKEGYQLTMQRDGQTTEQLVFLDD